MKIGEKNFNVKQNKVYVMGILNVTPDSFSDGGTYIDTDIALKHALDMGREGADIIDIGGESTRPGHEKISVQEEIDRVSTVISAIKKETDIPISIDTYKPQVAAAALDAGADMINDIWGLRYDKFNNANEDSEYYPCDKADSSQKETMSMAELASARKVPICIMYNDNLGRNMEERTDEVLVRYLESNSKRSAVELVSSIREEGVIDRIVWGLEESLDIAYKAGIDKHNIILDPGIGFAKTQKENLLVVKNLNQIVKRLGHPVLFAASRKSMIGNVLDLPHEEREEGTLVTTILAAQAGCRFVRVHDVEKNVRALKMLDGIMDLKN